MTAGILRALVLCDLSVDKIIIPVQCSMATGLASDDGTVSLCDECSQPEEDHYLVTIMAVGTQIKYTVPSFPVLTVLLREARFQFANEMECFDGYIRSCPSLDRTYPGLLKLCFGYKNAFSIDPEEFELSVPGLENKTLYEERVFVMWKWSWMDVSELDAKGSDKESDKVEEADNPDSGNEDELDKSIASSLVSHSVTFKCMGANKVVRSQEVLTESAQKLKKGEYVELRLRKEPSNPKDSRAIAFDCKHNNKWELIGYVVREALEDVHHAIENNLIVSVQFDWIRYITHWSRSGPAWYCGVKITKQGEWPSAIVRCGSTF